MTAGRFLPSLLGLDDVVFVSEVCENNIPEFLTINPSGMVHTTIQILNVHIILIFTPSRLRPNRLECWTRLVIHCGFFIPRCPSQVWTQRTHRDNAAVRNLQGYPFNHKFKINGAHRIPKVLWLTVFLPETVEGHPVSNLSQSRRGN